MSMRDPGLHLYELTTWDEHSGERTMLVEAFSAADAVTMFEVNVARRTSVKIGLQNIRCVGTHERLTEEQRRQLHEARG